MRLAGTMLGLACSRPLARPVARTMIVAKPSVATFCLGRWAADGVSARNLALCRPPLTGLGPEIGRRHASQKAKAPKKAKKTAKAKKMAAKEPERPLEAAKVATEAFTPPAGAPEAVPAKPEPESVKAAETAAADAATEAAKEQLRDELQHELTPSGPSPSAVAIDAATVAAAPLPGNLTGAPAAVTMNPPVDVPRVSADEGEGFTYADRLAPKWPLSREALPTLPLHSLMANTPRVSKDLSFHMLMRLLRNSREPEVLLYHSEPHRLYFVILYSAAVVFSVYGLLSLDWSLRESYKIFVNNEEHLSDVQNIAWYMVRSVASVAVFSIPAAMVYFFLKFPTHLVKRMWYMPAHRGVAEHVRFVTHPLLPGQASPVHTMPLEQLSRGLNRGGSKVWTGDGLYGTASRSQFMVFLFEEGKKMPWVVDRQGWFWGDGRVWDVLFGKESVAEAEAGLSGDDKIRMAQAEKKRLRQARYAAPAALSGPKKA
ncbi:uncharacterized protein V1510DRAFT_421800 [Dipodascopsis tothii]|uniref:uncharacterized protein n=1 Tax=Dipodascopsis tothii TaxID=44089 RepID=UPI0034CF01DE